MVRLDWMVRLENGLQVSSGACLDGYGKDQRRGVGCHRRPSWVGSDGIGSTRFRLHRTLPPGKQHRIRPRTIHRTEPTTRHSGRSSTGTGSDEPAWCRTRPWNLRSTISWTRWRIQVPWISSVPSKGACEHVQCRSHLHVEGVEHKERHECDVVSSNGLGRMERRMRAVSLSSVWFLCAGWLC